MHGDPQAPSMKIVQIWSCWSASTSFWRRCQFYQKISYDLRFDQCSYFEDYVIYFHFDFPLANSFRGVPIQRLINQDNDWMSLKVVSKFSWGCEDYIGYLFNLRVINLCSRQCFKYKIDWTLLSLVLYVLWLDQYHTNCEVCDNNVERELCTRLSVW